MKKITIRKIIFSILFLTSSYEYAFAACTSYSHLKPYTSTMPNKEYYIQYDNGSSHTLETITVRANPVIQGDPLGPDCNIRAAAKYSGLWPSRHVGDGTVQTNIDGIYLKVTIPRLGTNLPLLPGATPASGQVYDLWFELFWQIEIIKKGNVINSGSIDEGQLAEYDLFANINPTIRRPMSSLIINKNTLKIKVLNCSLKNNQSTYNINMGDKFDTQFKTIGDTTEPVDIPISLTCIGGTNIKTTITSSGGYIDAATGKLALTGADRATGIAIQLLDKNDNPIPLNQKNNLQDNVPSGDYILGWKARYIKTADTITTGTANASAIVNIRYE